MILIIRVANVSRGRTINSIMKTFIIVLFAYYILRRPLMPAIYYLRTTFVGSAALKAVFNCQHP